MQDDIRKKFLKEEYISRINRVIDYIELNLENELKLDTLSRVANFSPFHFHRIFRAITGEPLNQFIQRLRLEKAADQLIVNPKKTITRIAYDCGFGSSASFSRAFKEYFSTSPGNWRNPVFINKSKNQITDRKISKTKSNTGKDQGALNDYILRKSQNIIRRNAMKGKESKIKASNVDVKELPNMHVAYVRYTGPYKGDAALFEKLFNKLFTWAGPRDLLRFPETKVISVYHDNPEITDGSKLRTSVCITVPEDTKVSGEIGKMVITGGKYAIAHFELSDDEYQDAWNSLYSDWLPESGYQPDDRLSFELYLSDPKEHPKNKTIVDICVPVKPL